MLKIDTGGFIIGDDNASWVAIGIKLGMNQQTLLGGGVANRVENDFETGQWSTALVHGNLAEHAMLDLIPFACTWWKMTNRNGSVQFVGQALKRHFPQAAPTTVTAASVRCLYLTPLSGSPSTSVL